MRALIIALPACALLAACQVSKDEKNGSTTVEYNQDVAENAVSDVGNTAENVADKIGNEADKLGDKIDNTSVTVDTNSNKAK